VIREDGGNRRPRILRVLGALLGESPEASLLRHAVRPPMLLTRVEDRLRILEAVREDAPDVVVFAAHGSDRLPTAPLIDLCARARCDIQIVLLCAAPPPRSHAIIAAARVGARILVAPTANEITSVLTRMVRPSVLEWALNCEALAEVQPAMLRDLLCAAAKTVSEDGRVETLARHLRVSTRTLSRYSTQARLAPPRALLSVARLLWACALMESSRGDVRAVARATGFRDPQALMLARLRHLTSLAGHSSALRLPPYRDALRHAVGSIGGHLKPQH
jgi:AraC-like DNA-binding protein